MFKSVVAVAVAAMAMPDMANRPRAAAETRSFGFMISLQIVPFGALTG
jgi:hypothetical protein